MKPKKYIITIEISGTSLPDVYEDLKQLMETEPDFQHLKQRVSDITIDSEEDDL